VETSATTRRQSVSRIARTTSGLSPTRLTLWTIASRTGCASVGEVAIARRISAVAVCCSSAPLTWRLLFLELLEQASVRYRDGGLAGERLDERDLMRAEPADHFPRHIEDANGLCLVEERNREARGLQRRSHLIVFGAVTWI
jgi:hypothetical protein